MARPIISLCFVALILAQGCAATVLQANPRPNIDLPQNTASFALALNESVQDQYQTEILGKRAVNVSEWRQTLQNGFDSGFGSAFNLAEGKADLTLQVNEAVLSFAPTAVGNLGSVKAVEAQIRYKARLVDAQGQVLRRSTGTVSSKKSIAEEEEATSAAADAVESLYEKISHDFFSDAPAPAAESSPAQ